MNTISTDPTPSPAPHLNWKQLLLWSDYVIFFLLLGIAVTYGPESFYWYFGLGMALLSFPLCLLARFQLGKSFTASAQARRLVSTGLYRRFRHPIYLFGFIAHLGVFLALQNWWILTIWLAYHTLIQWKRIKREDEVLERAFGEDYRQLRRGTWI